jgi:hypothetical protein
MQASETSTRVQPGGHRATKGRPRTLISVAASLMLLSGCGPGDSPHVSGTTAAGQPLHVELDGAALRVPAGALPENITCGPQIFDHAAGWIAYS